MVISSGSDMAPLKNADLARLYTHYIAAGSSKHGLMSA